MWRNKEKHLPTENGKNLADAQGTTQNQQEKKKKSCTVKRTDIITL